MTDVIFRGWKCLVNWRQYGNGRPAIQLVDEETHEPVCTATVNLPDQPADPDEVYLKVWGGNEGVVEVLVAAGIIAPPHDKVRTGFVEAPKARLLKGL